MIIERVKTTDLCSGLAAGMNLELRENPLGAVPRGVSADPKLPRHGLVGAALSQEVGHLNLPACEAKTFSQKVLAAAVMIGRETYRVLILQVASELAQLLNRATQSVDQSAIATAQMIERAEEISQFSGRKESRDGPVCPCTRKVVIHSKPRAAPMVNVARAARGPWLIRIIDARSYISLNITFL